MNPDSLYVSSNDYEAAYTLTSEIIKHGHKDIGFHQRSFKALCVHPSI